jgi:hypothetical protein
LFRICQCERPVRDRLNSLCCSAVSMRTLSVQLTNGWYGVKGFEGLVDGSCRGSCHFRVLDLTILLLASCRTTYGRSERRRFGN